MISHYVVYEQGKDGEEGRYLAEFEQLEIAVDFVEGYRKKNPEELLEIRGVTYNRSDFKAGKPLSKWDAVPEAYRKDGDLGFETAAEEIFEEQGVTKRTGTRKRRFGIRRKN